MPGYVESLAALVEVRKRCGRHHQCWSGRSLRGAGVRGPAHRRTPSSRTSQCLATSSVRVMGTLVPLPRRANSAGRAPAVPLSALVFCKADMLKGSARDRWIHHRFQRWAFFVRSALLPLSGFIVQRLGALTTELHRHVLRTFMVAMTGFEPATSNG